MSDDDVKKPSAVIDPNLQALDEEIRQYEKYADSGVLAAAAAAARGASFGVSDAALRNAGVKPETLKGLQETFPDLSTASEIAGAVVPALVTGGTSTAAQAASAGTKALTAAGSVAERGALKALAKAAPQAGTASQKITAGAARGAGEGALVGVGQAISDAAIEDKDLTAESLIANAGAGALMGGGFGTAFGTAQAALPGIKAGIASAKASSNKLLKRAIDPITDPVEAGLRTVTATPAKRGDLRQALGERSDDLLPFLQNDLKITHFDTFVDKAQKNKAMLKATGKEIGELAKQLDDIVVNTGGGALSRESVYTPLLAKIDELEARLAPSVPTTNMERRMLRRYRQGVENNLKSAKPFSIAELDNLRKHYQDKANFTKFGTAADTYESTIANALRGEARAAIDNAADAMSQFAPELGSKLKAANKRFHIGQLIKKPLEEAAERQPSLTTPLAWAQDTASTVFRNGVVLRDAAKKTAEAQESMQKSLTSFFSRKAKTVAKRLASPTVLVRTGFALSPDTDEPPKTRQQAFKNVQANLAKAADQNYLVELLAKRTARVQNASPETAIIMQERLMGALQFLQQKIPKSTIQHGMFQREYTPSSLEMAKFERYVQIVENPLSALDELQKGSLTREHAEALQAVYPQIFRQIQTRTMDFIAQHPNLPYTKKLQLGVLLGVPADSSLQPEAIMGLQQSISGAPEAPEQSDDIDMSEADIAGRAATGVEETQIDQP